MSSSKEESTEGTSPEVKESTKPVVKRRSSKTRKLVCVSGYLTNLVTGVKYTTNTPVDYPKNLAWEEAQLKAGTLKEY